MELHAITAKKAAKIIDQYGGTFTLEDVIDLAVDHLWQDLQKGSKNGA